MWLLVLLLVGVVVARNVGRESGGIQAQYAPAGQERCTNGSLVSAARQGWKAGSAEGVARQTGRQAQ